MSRDGAYEVQISKHCLFSLYKYKYGKEIRKQMGGNNNDSNNHNNINSKIMKYPKLVGWSVVITTWAFMCVSLKQMKNSEIEKAKHHEVVLVAEEMIEWMYEDVENDRIPQWTAEEYIADLEYIIKEIK